MSEKWNKQPADSGAIILALAGRIDDDEGMADFGRTLVAPARRLD